MMQWGRWRPDVVAPNSAYCAIADSVLLQESGVGQYPGQTTLGYGPFPQLVTVATAGALSGAPRGIIALIDAGGAGQVFAATATTIEQLQSDYTFTAISSGRTVTAGDDVSFCRFGSFLLNTDTTDGFKAYNFDTPAGNNTVTAAPTARFVFSCNNVVFALSCGGNPLRMQSSGLGDHTEWIKLGANGETFTDGGSLQCGVDLKNGACVIFQAEAMRVIQFGSAPDGSLYTIQKAADGRGSVGQRSVVAFDGMVFYLAADGFYKFDLASGNTPIGAEKVNRWFLNQLAASDLVTVQAAIDPQRKIVYWRYRSVNNPSTTVFGNIIAYDWQLQEWFTLTVNTSALIRYRTPGYTLDGIDAFGPLDSFTTLLDDPFWTGGASVFGALDASFKFATFSGAPMAATLRSTLMNNPTSGRVGRATPISDSPNSTLQLGVSDKLSDPVVWKDGNSKGRAGAVPLRGRGLNIAFQENIPAGDMWTYSNGIDDIVSGSQGGPR
jgi:hypothetical protein